MRDKVVTDPLEALQAGTHAVTCAKANHHDQRCDCHLASNYPPPTLDPVGVARTQTAKTSEQVTVSLADSDQAAGFLEAIARAIRERQQIVGHSSTVTVTINVTVGRVP